jgi:hypothetical protein
LTQEGCTASGWPKGETEYALLWARARAWARAPAAGHEHGSTPARALQPAGPLPR